MGQKPEGIYVMERTFQAIWIQDTGLIAATLLNESPIGKLVNPTAFMGRILEKEPLFSPVENQFLPRYQLFDANPDQTTDWHLAASNRFCEIFDELLSTQKMFEVIAPTHAVEMSELLGT